MPTTQDDVGPALRRHAQRKFAPKAHRTYIVPMANPRLYPARDRSVHGSPRDFAAELNAEQAAAATHGDGPLLIIAGAGTGKTRTLVYRVAHLLELGVRAERILLLTFTRRAAHEMLGRAERLVGSASRGVQGGTFHGT